MTMFTPYFFILTFQKNSMIRLAITILISLLAHAVVLSQNSFVDKLKHSTWTSEVPINHLTSLSKQKEISLRLLNSPADSLQKEASVWTFSEGKLVIKNPSVPESLSKDSLQYRYTFDPANMRMKILNHSPESNFTEYALTFVSTGNYLLLRRRKNN